MWKKYKILLIVIAILFVFVFLIKQYIVSIANDISPESTEVFSDMLSGNKTITVVLQNNAELRPNGGFLSSVLQIKTVAGIPYTYDFLNSYDFDSTDIQPLESPSVLSHYFSWDDAYKGFLFRDTNWEVSLPDSIPAMMHYYQAKMGTTPDYLFFVDMSAVESLFRILDSFQVGDTEYSADNLFLQLEFATKNFDKHSLEGHNTRKNILRDLFSLMQVRFAKYVLLQPGMLSCYFESMLREKHIQIYAANYQQRQVLESLGVSWSFDDAIAHYFDYQPAGGTPGEYKQDFYDVIGSNIANLGSRKSDRYIKKDISYDVYIDADGQIYVSQRFLYKHNGEYNAFSTLYNGYQRTMIPFGAQMRSIYGSINNQDYLLLGDYNNQSFVRSFNLNKQHNIYEQNYVYNTLENYIEVAPDRETYFGYDYFFENTKKGNNGEDAMIDTYHLGVVKQPGSEQTYYHIEIKVPEGYLLQVENQNHQGYLREYVYTYDGELNSDFLLDLNIVRDTTPPIILDQKIGHDLREIQVYFDKDIDESSLFLGNIQIQDTDRVFPSKTDASIHPYKVEVISGKQLNIYVSGITDQPDEAYSIDIVGLQDVYENALTPDPHTITVIQNNFTF